MKGKARESGAISANLRGEAAGLRTRELLLAGGVLILCLAAAYGPAKLAGHLIYGGVIQDVTNLYGFFAWDDFSRQELLSFRFPLWNPYNAFGVPHLANMQSAVFFPLNWLKFIFGFFPVIDFILVFRLFLAGFFTYVFARRALVLSVPAGLLSGVSFMLCGYLTRYVYMSHLNVECLFPLVLVAGHELLRKPDLKRFVLAVVGFALAVWGGFPEATLYGFLLAGLYLLHEGRGKRGAVVLIVSALGAGVLLSCVQWLPFAEYLPHAWTYHGPESGLRHLDPRLMISLLLPWFFGENNISPAAPFLAPYLGVVPCFFFFCVLLKPRQAGARVFFFAMLSLAFACLMFGLFPLSLLGRLYPFSLAYNDKYAAPCLALCTALVAGKGLDLVLREKSLRVPGLVFGLLVGFVLLNVAGGYRNWFKPFWALGLLQPAMLFEALSVLAALFVLVFMLGKGILGRRSAAAGFVILSALGLVFDMAGHNPSWHDELKETTRRTAKAIAPSEGRYRIFADDGILEFFPNRLLPHRVEDIRYYGPLYPRSYVKCLSIVNELSGDSVLSHYQEHMLFSIKRESLGHPLLKLGGVAFYILTLPLEERLLVKEWAGKAETLSDRKESWLRGERALFAGSVVLSLLEHAPVKIQGPELEPAARSLVFSLGQPESMVSAPGPKGDGMWFMIETDEDELLLFARYLDPKNRRDERKWKEFEVPLSSRRDRRGGRSSSRNPCLLMLAGPRNDRTRDAGLWGLLRTRGLWRGERLSLEKKESGLFLYRDPGVYPSAFWVRGYAQARKHSGYYQDLEKIAARSPSTFSNIALVARGDFPLPEKGERSVDDEFTRLAGFFPGRLLVENSRAHPGFVVVSSQYLPGWRAFLLSGHETKEVPVIQADGPFMAAPVPAGKHTLEFSYRPWGFRVGLFIALAGILSLVSVMSGNLVHSLSVKARRFSSEKAGSTPAP